MSASTDIFIKNGNRNQKQKITFNPDDPPLNGCANLSLLLFAQPAEDEAISIITFSPLDDTFEKIFFEQTASGETTSFGLHQGKKERGVFSYRQIKLAAVIARELS